MVYSMTRRPHGTETIILIPVPKFLLENFRSHCCHRGNLIIPKLNSSGTIPAGILISDCKLSSYEDEAYQFRGSSYMMSSEEIEYYLRSYLTVNFDDFFVPN